MTIRFMFRYIILFSIFLFQQDVCPVLPPHYSYGVADLGESVAMARDSFEDYYLRVLTENEKFFDDAYNNNLVVTTEIDWDFGNNGVIFMRLIDFLEGKEGEEAAIMLSKINELFYLLFHRHLSHLDVQRDKQVQMIRGLHQLFNFKNADGKYVLRSTLTRMFIYTLMVEVLGLHYSEKREVLLFAYEDFRSALSSFIVDYPNAAEIKIEINDLVSNLAAYGVKEPIVRPKNIKRWIYFFIAAALIGGVVYYACKKIGTWEHFKSIVDDLVESATKKFSETLVKNFSEPTAKAMIDEMKSNSEVLGSRLAKGMAENTDKVGAALIEGIVYEDVDAPPIDTKKKRKNRTTQQFAEGLGRDLSYGLVYEDVDTPPVDPKKKRKNQATAQLGEDLGDTIITGATKKVKGLTHAAVAGALGDDDGDETKAGRVRKSKKSDSDLHPAVEKVVKKLRGQVDEVVTDVNKRVKKTVHKAKKIAGELIDNVEDKVDGLVEGVEGRVHRLRRGLRSDVDDVVNSTVDKLENTKVLGAMGGKITYEQNKAQRRAAAAARQVEIDAEYAAEEAARKAKNEAARLAKKAARDAQAAARKATKEAERQRKLDAQREAEDARLAKEARAGKAKSSKKPELDVAWRSEIADNEHKDYEQYLYNEWLDELDKEAKKEASAKQKAAEDARLAKEAKAAGDKKAEQAAAAKAKKDAEDAAKRQRDLDAQVAARDREAKQKAAEDARLAKEAKAAEDKRAAQVAAAKAKKDAEDAAKRQRDLDAQVAARDREAKQKAAEDAPLAKEAKAAADKRAAQATAAKAKKDAENDQKAAQDKPAAGAFGSWIKGIFGWGAATQSHPAEDAILKENKRLAAEYHRQCDQVEKAGGDVATVPVPKYLPRST